MTSQTGTSKNDTLIFASSDLTIDGLGGTDTLLFNQTDATLTSTFVTSMEILKANITSQATVFTVNKEDLATNGSILGNVKDDTLTIVGTAFDLTHTTLSSVEKLVADATTTIATLFTLDQKDLIAGGTVGGTSFGGDTLAINGTSLDLTGTTLSSIEILKAGKSAATTFILDNADLTPLTDIIGSSGSDTLQIKTGAFDMTGIDLDSIENLKTGVTTGVTFTLDDGQLKANGGSVINITGSTGTDTLIVNGTDFDLSSTVLSSIEKLTASDNGTDGTIFHLDQADLGKGVIITGSSSVEDEITATGSALDLSSSTITDVEFLSTAYSKGTTFTLSGLTGLDQISGSSATVGSDTLVFKGTAFNLTGITLHDLDALKAGNTGTVGTTFTLDDPSDVNSITGLAKSDTLAVNGTDFDLTGTTLSSVEILKGLYSGTTDGTVFLVDQADLAKGGSVLGTTSTKDTLETEGTGLDITSTTLSSVEILHGTNTAGTTFTMNGGQFVAVGDINGDGTADILVLKTTDFDIVGGATLNGIEQLKAGAAGATSFFVNKSQLVSGVGDINKIIGGAGSDTLTVLGNDFDLSGVALSSIEKLQAEASTNGTVFTFSDSPGKLTIIGNTGTGATDSIVASGTQLDISSTTLSSIEELTTTNTFGTAFTLTNAQLGGLKITGAAGVDTVKITTTTIDFTSTTLTSIEGVGAGSTKATTITLNDTQLKANGGVIANIEGNAGSDTLKINGTDFDLSQTTASSIEKLMATGTLGVLFTVNNADLASGGSILGITGKNDEVKTFDTELDLSHTTLSSIEKVSTGNTNGTLFTVTTAQLKSLTLNGGSGSDTLSLGGTSAFDVSTTTLNSIEKLQGGGTNGTTFTVTDTQLVGLTDITGTAGKTDTLIVKGCNFNLTSTTLTSVETLKAGISTATFFTVNQADITGLGTSGQITGSSGNDTLQTHEAALDLSSTALTSIELIKSDNTNGTTFTLKQANLNGGTVEGDAVDTIVAAQSTLDLTSTTLVSIEVLKAGVSTGTTFTVDTGDLSVLTDIEGHSSGTDSLVVKGTTDVDLTATTLSSIEKLSGTLSTDTRFTLDHADLAELKSVTGSTGTDTLIVNDTDFDLSSTALTSIEKLQAGDTNGTTFTLTQDDLANGGSVIGSSTGTDTIAAGGVSLDLTSTTLSSIEKVTISATTGATLTVTATQLSSLNVTGGNTTTNDTLVVAGTAFDLTSTTLTDFEALQAGSSLGTTFTLDFADVTALGAGGSITGSTSATDTLTILGTNFDLSSTVLTSVEILQASANGTNSTTFTLDGDDIASGGQINGSANNADKIIVSNSTIDLSSTTLSNIEKLEAGSTDTTTFTLTQTQVNGLAITGSSNTDDTLVIAGDSYNLTSATLSSIENLRAESGDDTTFTVDQADLVAGGSVTGLGGDDVLIVKGTQADLSSTSIDSVETLQASSTANTTFIVNDDDLAAQNGAGGGFTLVQGSGGTDTLQAADTSLDLTGTDLSSIEVIAAGNSLDTTFTVDQDDIEGLTVKGSSGNDTLEANEAGLDLTSTTLSSVEIISVNKVGGDITLDQADLIAGGTVVGDGSSNAIIINGTALDLSSTTLSSIQTLTAGTSSGTTFTVNFDDLKGGGGSVTAINGSTGIDTVVAADTQIDLTSTTLSSIEKIATGDSDTTITVNQTTVNAVASIVGGAGLDTLTTAETGLDLSSTTVTAVEALTSSNTDGTTFTVDQSDLAFSGSVVGSGTTDILQAAGSSLSLTNVTLTGIEELGTVYSNGTVFTVDAADLAVATIVNGSSGNDTLTLTGAAFDLTSATLSSIEILKATGAAAVTFTVDAADLAVGGSVLGIAGKNDTLTIVGTTDFDLSHTTLSSVEKLLADQNDTTFKLDQADLASTGTITGLNGGADTDIVAAAGTQLDLTSTTLVEIEEIHSGLTLSTTFTVDAADLVVAPTVVGSVAAGTDGLDTLIIKGATYDVTSTTLTDIDILQAGSTSATTFNVDQADLISGGSVVGSTSAGDSLIVAAAGTIVDLSATTLTGIETIKAANTAVATQFEIGNGQGGATLDLVNSNKSDTIDFSAAYNLSVTPVDDSAINAHTLNIENFTAGSVTGDTIDIAALSNGNPGSSLDLTDYITLSGVSTLKDALDIASIGDGSSTASVVTFEYSGDTYVLVDNSASKTLTNNDSVIKLVGVDHNDLVTGNFTL